MITAAAHIFPCFRRCVTTLSGQRDTAAQRTLVTCDNAIHVTIYSCRN
jgi:hypothetical protein